MNKLYQEIRQSIGTKEKVAGLLGVSRFTLWRREIGKSRVTPEHIEALRNLKNKEEEREVNVAFFDRKKGLIHTKTDFNRLLEAANSGLTYVKEYGTFTIRDKKLFMELIAEAME